MANPRPRYIRPVVMPDYDTPVVQLKCDPSEDDFDVDVLIHEAVKRFEFQLGAVFQVQICSMDMTTILACRSYIMQRIDVEMRTDDIDYYRTITRPHYDRHFAPLTDWFVFDDRAERFSMEGSDKPRRRRRSKVPVEEKPLANCTPAEMQKIMKDLTGKGFAPGVDGPTMRKAISAERTKRGMEVDAV